MTFANDHACIVAISYVVEGKLAMNNLFYYLYNTFTQERVFPALTYLTPLYNLLIHTSEQ